MEYLPRNNYFVDKMETNNIPFNLKPDGGVQKLRSFTFDILQSLHYIHSNGIIHMDIKPGNFLLSEENMQDDEWPLVKLCDFGLSRFVGLDGFIQSTVRTGTEEYIAPEVGKGFINQAVDM